MTQKQKVIVSFPLEVDAARNLSFNMENMTATVNDIEHTIRFGESTSILVTDENGNVVANTTHLIEINSVTAPVVAAD